MRFVFTGAGGGHFYPLIAVAEAVRAEVFIRKIEDPEFYFLSDAPYDEGALQAVRMTYIHIPAGKRRLYGGFQNSIDMFKTVGGIFVSIVRLFQLYPDVVFAKGGYASFPVLCASRLLGIPVIVHESDTVAGRVTQWAGKFADRVALSQGEASGYFTKAKQVALTGQPIRMKYMPPLHYERVTDEKERQTLLVIGGSQGSDRINQVVIAALPELIKHFDIVHQTGLDHEVGVRALAEAALKDEPLKDRYYAKGFIDLSLYYPKIDIALSRAGSTVLFELAMWQIPSVVVPLPRDISRDQTSNAYAFAKKGTCIVLEETNLNPTLLGAELLSVVKDHKRYVSMSKAGSSVVQSRDAALIIGREMLAIARTHT